MKFETLVLQSLFTVCLLICLFTLGSMLTSSTAAPHLATGHAPTTAVASAAR